jgi:hypothetical protein
VRSELDPDLASARLAHARMTARQGDLEGVLAGLREAHRVANRYRTLS